MSARGRARPEGVARGAGQRAPEHGALAVGGPATPRGPSCEHGGATRLTLLARRRRPPHASAPPPPPPPPAARRPPAMHGRRGCRRRPAPRPRPSPAPRSAPPQARSGSRLQAAASVVHSGAVKAAARRQFRRFRAAARGRGSTAPAPGGRRGGGQHYRVQSVSHSHGCWEGRWPPVKSSGAAPRGGRGEPHPSECGRGSRHSAVVT
jgi:hypothetical protein